MQDRWTYNAHPGDGYFWMWIYQGPGENAFGRSYPEVMIGPWFVEVTGDTIMFIGSEIDENVNDELRKYRMAFYKVDVMASPQPDFEKVKPHAHEIQSPTAIPSR